MNGIRFYADLAGTISREDWSGRGFEKSDFSKKTTRAQLVAAANIGKKCNVIAVFTGKEHRYGNGDQEALGATFAHPDSDVSVGAVAFEYLRGCRRISESLARRLHPRLFERLDRVD